MLTPKPLPSGQLSTQLRGMREKIDSLAPRKSVGILTSRTTRGVTRRPVPEFGDPGRRKNVARWA